MANFSDFNKRISNEDVIDFFREYLKVCEISKSEPSIKYMVNEDGNLELIYRGQPYEFVESKNDKSFKLVESNATVVRFNDTASMSNLSESSKKLKQRFLRYIGALKFEPSNVSIYLMSTYGLFTNFYITYDNQCFLGKLNSNVGNTCFEISSCSKKDITKDFIKFQHKSIIGMFQKYWETGKDCFSELEFAMLYSTSSARYLRNSYISNVGICEKSSERSILCFELGGKNNSICYAYVNVEPTINWKSEILISSSKLDLGIDFYYLKDTGSKINVNLCKTLVQAFNALGIHSQIIKDFINTYYSELPRITKDELFSEDCFKLWTSNSSSESDTINFSVDYKDCSILQGTVNKEFTLSNDNGIYLVDNQTFKDSIWEKYLDMLKEQEKLNSELDNR